MTQFVKALMLAASFGVAPLVVSAEQEFCDALCQAHHVQKQYQAHQVVHGKIQELIGKDVGGVREDVDGLSRFLEKLQNSPELVAKIASLAADPSIEVALDGSCFGDKSFWIPDTGDYIYICYEQPASTILRALEGGNSE